MSLIKKIQRKLMHMRLQPIRVFCFHHVSEERDPLVCQVEDWTQLSVFQQNIEQLSKQYTFISLSEAYKKLRHDVFRIHRYAVLTADDGLASIQNVLPWLEKRQIPITLFVNTRYMKGDILKPVHEKWLRELTPDVETKTIAQKMYLSEHQIKNLCSQYIEIGLHGHEHLDATKISESVFEKDITTCIEMIHTHPRYIPMYAYPWGCSTNASMNFLKRQSIVPVVVRGGKNYGWLGYVDRECIDNKYLK